MRKYQGIVAAAMCSVALTACAGGPPPPDDLTPASVPAGLERFYRQQLDWGSCGPFGATDEERLVWGLATVFTCAHLEVPLDYAAPSGRTAQIAVLRIESSEQKIGSLVVNPGGPGLSGIHAVAGQLAALTGGPFDIVGFDPRGVGASTPALRCPTEDDDTDDGDPEPADAAGTEVARRELVARCVEMSGGVDVIANSGTRDVVRDLDVLRATLGDAQLSYLGFSYGTRIGAEYAERFPRNVRAMVLDGAIDPAQDAIESAAARSAAFQRTFDAYARHCAAAPGCPLGTDPVTATAAFRSLARPLVAKPVPVGDRELTAGHLTIAVLNAMYSSALWPQLTDALAALAAGDGRELLELAEGDPAKPGGSATTAAEIRSIIINCVDGDQITDPAAAAERARRMREAAPFLDFEEAGDDALDACAFLPVHPTMTPHVPRVDGLPPTLVVSTTGDPATPYEAGVALAKHLDGRLLTVEGNQHTAFLSSTCVDDLVVPYLRNLELPPDGARCAR